MSPWQTSRTVLVRSLAIVLAVALLAAAGACAGQADRTKATAPPPVTASTAQPTSSAASMPAPRPWLLGQPISFQHISIEEGLSQSSVTAILQDSHGFMWFGTNDGLNKYDGYGFKVYRADPQDGGSLSESAITAIVEDHRGTLWIGTPHGLNRFDRDSETFATYYIHPTNSQGLPRSTINALFVDRAGVLWVGANSGLYHFDPDSEQFLSHMRSPRNLGGLGDLPVFAIRQDAAGTLWVGARRGLYGHPVEDERFHFYRPDPSATSADHNTVRSIAVDPSGVIWVGTAGGGFFRFDPATTRFDQYLVDPSDVNGYAFNDIPVVYPDQAGNLWIGSDGGGFYQFDPVQERLHGYQTDPRATNSLSSNYVWSIYEGQPGVLWVGTYGGGIDKFDRYQERFAHFQHDPANPNSLSHNRVLALYHDDQDALWIGTDGGGLDRYDRQTGQFTHFQSAPEAPSGLGNNYVSDVVADRRGRLWIATWGGGISVLDPQAGTFVQVRADPLNSDSLSTDTVVSLLIDRQGTLWAATVGAGLDRLAVPDVLDPDRMAFEHFRAARLAPNRLSDSYVFRMIEDLDGTLWLGTRDGGLSHFDPASRRFVTYRADPSTPGALQSNFVPGLLLDRFGTLWIGTAAGLSRYNREDDSFDHFTTEDGLPDDIVVAIQEDDEGYLWLSTQRGLARFDPEREAFKNYGVSDGLQGYEFTTAAARAPDGTLFVGGINGFNRIDPDQVIDNPQVPPVVLTSLEQNGRPLARDASLENLRGITLRWPDNDFQFEFAALNYSQSQRNQYAYMLEGFDDDWNQLGNRRFGRYTNLPGGTYTLRIKGSNNDGLWNEAGTAIAVSVVPPFWQSRWFQLVAVLVLASAAVAGYRLRVRGIRARSLALEEEVKQRTREMERRQQELEALYRADEQLYSHLQLDHVLQSLVDIAVDTLKADKSAVFRWDEAVERYRMRVSRGFSSQALETLAFPRGQGVLDYVTNTGDLVVSEDAVNDPRRAAESPEAVEAVLEEGVRSFLMLPVQVNGEVFGVFNVSYTRTHAFGDEERRLFTALAQRAAQAIQNARLFDAEKRRAEQFRVISEVGREMTAIMTVEQTLERMARLIKDTFDYYHVGIGLIEDGYVVYRVGAGELWDDPGFKFKPARLQVGREGVSGWVAATGQPHLVRDVRQDPLYVLMRGSHTRSELTVPIQVKGQVIGVLDVQSNQISSFDETDVAVLQALAHQAGAAIENTQLYEQAQRAAVIEERSRLARDLHDAVTQTLFSASLLAEVLPATWESNRAEGQKLLGELRQLSRGALAEMRALLLELRPAALVEADLDDLLRQLAEAFTGRSGVPVDLDLAFDCDLDQDVHVALYRIAQEALNNIVKHARASRAALSLHCEPQPEGVDGCSIQQVVLCISDDGIGFDPHDVSADHLGLGIIRERAQSIGARLAIDTSAERGTRIQVVWQRP